MSAPEPIEFTEAELAPLRALRARFQGGLHGLAVGDALAAATQFRRAGSFAPVGDLLGGGPFDLPRGAWSDDTAMALCLADSLLERGACDVDDQRARYLRWQREGYLSATGHCLGITAATAQALAGPGVPATPPATGATAAAAPLAGHAPGEPLARLLPVVLRTAAFPGRCDGWAAASARATTESRLSIDACRLLAAMLQAALRGAGVAQLLRPDLAALADGAAGPLCEPVALLAASDPGELPTGQPGQALEVLALARWCLAGTGSFRAGALQAANLGGDSDQVCAIYGQLAGLHYGVAAIPRGWRLALAQAELLTETADRLLREAVLELDPEATPPAAAPAAARAAARVRKPRRRAPQVRA